MVFLIASSLLLIAVIVLFVWAVARKPIKSPDARLHDQLTAELSDDVVIGVLAPEDLEPAKEDLEADPDEEFSKEARKTPLNYKMLAALLLIPLVAGLMYWRVGDWRAAIQGDRAAVIHVARQELVDLRNYLVKHPKDEQGWITLGQTETAFGHYKRAASAYEKAVHLNGEKNPDLLAAWGGALMLSDPGHPTGQEQAIFSAVLKADPTNPRGLWYGGVLAFANGHPHRGAELWKRLLNQPIPSAMGDLIRNKLDQLGYSTQDSNEPAANATSPRVTAVIGVSPAAKAKLASGEALFVYVRLPSGGRPLAVKRMVASSFPATTTLTTGDTMGSLGLEAAAGKTVNVVARLSRSGQAMPMSGDWYGEATLKLHRGSNRVNIQINHQFRVSSKSP